MALSLKNTLAGINSITGRTMAQSGYEIEYADARTLAKTSGGGRIT
jgi:hypothetical protein